MGLILKKSFLRYLKLKEKKGNSLQFIFRVLIDSLSIGIAVVGSIIAGAVIGWLIDEKVFKGRTFPWITIIFIIFGVIGGFKNLIYYSKKRLKEVEKQEKDESNKC